MSDELQTNYDALTPDLVVNAIESQGYLSDLRILALNSYENRVYQVGLEEQKPVVAKFYRPGRWSDAQIQEEHNFTRQLYDNEIPVIPALQNSEGNSLFLSHGYRFSLYERKGGRAPELSDLEHLYQLGRYIGRIHATGVAEPYHHRPAISVESFLIEPHHFLLENDFIPADLLPAYSSVMKELLAQVENHYQNTAFDTLRLHGDCHVGNILWSDEGNTSSDGAGPRFLDFDDSRMGPAVQDIWMLLSGSEEEQRIQLTEIIEGYEEFYPFNKAEIGLIESLRTMRLVHYAGWIARRWQDPAFPMAFPWFNEQKYWEQHILELREQLANLQHRPLDILYNQ